MVWEGQMAPRQRMATAEERYLMGLMTPEEKFEYEKQRYAQSFAEQDAAHAQLDEQAAAEQAAAEQAARLQGEIALGPERPPIKRNTADLRRTMCPNRRC